MTQSVWSWTNRRLRWEWLELEQIRMGWAWRCKVFLCPRAQGISHSDLVWGVWFTLACGSLELGWNGTEMCLQGWVPPLVRRAFFCHHEKSFPSIVIVFWTGLPVSARDALTPGCTRPGLPTEHTLDHQTLAELQLRENQWLVFILIFIGISLFYSVLVSAGEQSESVIHVHMLTVFQIIFP